MMFLENGLRDHFRYKDKVIMKAAVLLKNKNTLSILDDLQIPRLKKGQVLVKLSYSGVCHSQLMEVRGLRGIDKFLPHLLGHEGSGVVIKTGPQVKKVKKGDFVILGWIKGNGYDAGGCVFSSKKLNCNINAGPVTTFSEFSVVSENRVTIKPDKLPLDISVLFGCALLTGSGMIINDIKPAKGSNIAIFGLGGIGMSALIALNLFNCKKIIAIDVSEAKLKLAKSLGATHTINSNIQDPVDLIKNKICKKEGLKYSVEASGKVNVIEQAFEAIMSNGGECYFASHPEYGKKISLDPHQLISGKKIFGSWGGGSFPDKDIPVLAKLYLNGKLPLEKLLGKKYTLEMINEALNDLEKKEIGRPLIVLDSSI